MIEKHSQGSGPSLAVSKKPSWLKPSADDGFFSLASYFL
jgi:hypothetical protein